MDNKVTDEIRKLISEIAEYKIKDIISNMEFVYDGIIVNKNGVLFLEVMDSEFELSSVPNYSGVELKEGNAVRVYARGNKNNDMYIGICFNNTSWNIMEVM